MVKIKMSRTVKAAVDGRGIEVETFERGRTYSAEDGTPRAEALKHLVNINAAKTKRVGPAPENKSMGSAPENKDEAPEVGEENEDADNEELGVDEPSGPDDEDEEDESEDEEDDDNP